MLRLRKKEQNSGVAMWIAEAILGVFIGGAVAAAWLAIQVVTVVDAPPKPVKGEVPARHSVVYVNGRETPLRQSQWQKKQRAFLEKDPKGIELQEQDVNRWVATEFGAVDRTMKWESFGVEYRGDLPRFRFDGETVKVGMISDLTVPGSAGRKLVVQAAGTFQRRNGGFRFVPKSMLIGALPVPFETLRNKVGDLFLGSLVASNAFLECWNAIAEIEVEEGRMKVGFNRTSAVGQTAGVVPPASRPAVPPPGAEANREAGATAREVPALADGQTPALVSAGPDGGAAQPGNEPQVTAGEFAPALPDETNGPAVPAMAIQPDAGKAPAPEISTPPGGATAGQTSADAQLVPGSGA